MRVNEHMGNEMQKITVFTDGGCCPNPGQGGWGAVVLRDGSEAVELCGGEAKSTNNRCEMLAAIRALQSLESGCEVVLNTDSEYLRKGITEWMKAWRRRGWKTADKKDVKNRDLWEVLSAECDRHTVTWHWLKGHAGNVWNERADVLATRGREMAGKG